MNEIIVAVLLTTIPVAVWGTSSVVQTRRAKRRLVAIEDWAKQRGFTYDPRMEWEIPPELTQFEELSLGMGRAMEHRMQGQSSGMPVRIFDLRYGTSHGHHRWTVANTIIELSSPKLSLPSFRIEPENVLHKVAEAMGAQDIDFESHPRFSDKYLLRGKSEEQIRGVFRPAVLDWFEQHLGLTVEAAGDRMLLHRSKLLTPDQIDADLASARELHDLFV